jgi:hypothetical protein
MKDKKERVVLTNFPSFFPTTNTFLFTLFTIIIIIIIIICSGGGGSSSSSSSSSRRRSSSKLPRAWQTDRRTLLVFDTDFEHGGFNVLEFK